MDQRESFLAWAREAHVPLTAGHRHRASRDLALLREMIGQASVVTFGEALHGCGEPLEFRNRLLEYLVAEKSFTAIAMESGLVEGHLVHDYVAGGEGELSDVMARGFSWTFDRLPQNRELVQWLRDYNARPETRRKINFYGFDVPGSPGNSKVARGVDTALRALLAYLERVDRGVIEGSRSRLAPLLRDLGPGYAGMSSGDRNALTATIADLCALMECSEAQYIAASTRADYEWAYRAGIGARQVDSWLRARYIAAGSNDGAPDAMNGAALYAALRAEQTRDRAQADNLEWIVHREGPQGKLLVFAHRFHLSTAPVTRCLLNEAVETQHYGAGTYLKRRFGRRLVTIANLVGESEAGEAAESSQSLARAAEDSIDGFVAGVGAPCFLLDIRAAPPRPRAWLAVERSREHPVARRGQAFKLRVGKAFDILLYMDRVR